MKRFCPESNGLGEDSSINTWWVVFVNSNAVQWLKRVLANSQTNDLKHTRRSLNLLQEESVTESFDLMPWDSRPVPTQWKSIISDQSRCIQRLRTQEPMNTEQVKIQSDLLLLLSNCDSLTYVPSNRVATNRSKISIATPRDDTIFMQGSRLP